MKIALVIPVMTTVPPKKYGGIEQVVSSLALGLAKQHHSVTIFAAKGSKFKNPRIKIVECAPFSTFDDLSQNRKWEVHEFLSVIARQDDFDLIHFHYEPAISQAMIDNIGFNFLNYIHTPFLITFHNSTHIERNIKYYRSHKDLWKFNYVFISENHRQPLKFLPHGHVVYNGIPVERFSFNRTPKEYVLFVGRLMREKGIIDAISAAKLAGKKLIILGKVDAPERDFYNREVKRHIDGKQVINVGEVNFEQKVRYYKNATCLLFPISWNEPFGLVMVEALACGTPVIAYSMGSVPEIVKDNKSGYLVKGVKEMAAAINKINRIDRLACRKYVEENFSTERMVSRYISVYKKILGKRYRH